MLKTKVYLVCLGVQKHDIAKKRWYAAGEMVCVAVFWGDNINRAMNLTFTAAIALRGVAEMSQNFLLLFLNFHTIAGRG